jgi:hypothetical protein
MTKREKPWERGWKVYTTVFINYPPLDPEYNRDQQNDISMVKAGGLDEGDLNMGDSSDIINLRYPTNAKDAVNKQWVENNFARTIPSGKYVEKVHHKVAQWI